MSVSEKKSRGSVKRSSYTGIGIDMTIMSPIRKNLVLDAAHTKTHYYTDLYTGTLSAINVILPVRLIHHTAATYL